MTETIRRSSLLNRWPAFVLLILISGPLFASAEKAASSLETRINIDLREPKVEEVFRVFAMFAGASLELDARVDGTLKALTLDNVTVRTALNAACESVGCRWELVSSPDSVLVITPADAAETVAPAPPVTLAEPVNLSLSGAMAQAVFGSFATILGCELELDEALRGLPVTIEVESDPISEALEQTCDLLNCAWERVESDRCRLRVVPRDS